MKRVLLLMAAFSLLTIGMVSCDRNDDTTNNQNTPSTPSTPSNPTNPTNPTDPTDPAADAWVDLGLPSGLLWASCNIGSTTPEGYGDYYAWGETVTKEEYNWNTYQWCNGHNHVLTKYCNKTEYGSDGYTDNLTTLDPDDDAATVALGNGARIPTADEWQELLNRTTAEHTTLNNVDGYKFTSRANGNSIFLPSAGLKWNTGNQYEGSFGFYMSSSLFLLCPDVAWYCMANNMCNTDGRASGFSVRAVRPAPQE